MFTCHSLTSPSRGWVRTPCLSPEGCRHTWALGSDLSALTALSIDEVFGNLESLKQVVHFLLYRDYQAMEIKTWGWSSSACVTSLFAFFIRRKFIGTIGYCGLSHLRKGSECI